MRRSVLSLIALLGLLAPAIAQVNVVPQVGLVTSYLPKATYSAGFIGLVPAASATDIVCIAGSASRTIKVQKFVLSGSAGTLVTVPVALYKHTAANTGGTLAGTTANPANNIGLHDSQQVAATAGLVSYTANPTIGAAGPILTAASLTLPVTSAAVVSAPLVIDFGAGNANLLAPLVLRGTAQQACLNLTGVSVSSGVLSGSITWTEE